MNATAEPAKTPLDFALEHITQDDVRRKVLEVAHGLVSTCMTQAMLQTTGKDAATIAAEAQAYARQLQELERHLGRGFSAVPVTAPRTIYTTSRNMPQQPTQ